MCVELDQLIVLIGSLQAVNGIESALTCGLTVVADTGSMDFGILEVRLSLMVHRFEPAASGSVSMHASGKPQLQTLHGDAALLVSSIALTCWLLEPGDCGRGPERIKRDY
jgi:hypothetical protein